MVRSAAVAIENNFSKGLITEATAMNFPENSVIETDNCIYSKTGKVIRRYGIDYESSYQINDYSTIGVYSTATTPSDYYGNEVFVEYEWSTVNKTGATSFIVQQIGNRIVFYQTSATNNVSAYFKSFTIDLKTYQIPTFTSDVGQFIGAVEASFAGGFGYLFIAHPYCNPLYVVYDPDTDAITVSSITITIRDFERLNDSLAVDSRPSTLTDLHKYNLYNQGWYLSAANAGGTTSNVNTYWDGARTDFPSNADIWWTFKNSSEKIDSTLFDTQALGNTPAPNGHYTYNAFSVDRDAVLGTTGLPSVTTNNRPSLVAFFSGRVWYAGVQETGYATKIYFSKIIEGVTDFGLCYQQNDPTSETAFDLLPSDGGVINIPDVAKVMRLVPIGSSILVFATNGVWAISGPNNVFAANDFSVTKISNIGIAAPNSVVVVDGLPMWWDTSGIYTLTTDQSTGKESVTNISETTIQSLITALPDGNLRYVKGVYNNIDKNVHWIYRSTTPTNPVDNYTYDKLLVLNVPSASFSLNTFESSVPKVCGLIFTSFSSRDSLVNVDGASLVKYMTYGDFGTSNTRAVTVSQFNDSTYYDWKTYDGVGKDAESYFITGYRVRGELLKKTQSNYIVVVLETQENASCYLQGIWDYSNTTANGRYTTRQQVYRDDSTFDYSRSKLKIRGNGYSLQFKFSSEPGKPFTLIGWATSDTGNNVP